jgi:hypothetical protein
MEIAKKPVIFVVDTVIGGLIDTFNKIPGVNITKPKLPSSFYGQAASAPTGKRGTNRFFAKGGYAAPGWAVVGEEGPELVNFSKPGRVYTAKESAKMLHEPAHLGNPGAAGFYWTAFQKEIRETRKLGLTSVGSHSRNSAWQPGAAAGAWNGITDGLSVGIGNKGGAQGYFSEMFSSPYFGPGTLGFAWPHTGGIILNGSAATSPAMKRAVMIHEIGHVLGLPHTNGASIMQPYLGNYMNPTASDFSNIRSLYPGAAGSRKPGSVGASAAPDNPFTGLVDTLMGAFKKAFPGAGMFVDVAGGLAKSGIESVVKIVTDIQNGIKDLAGNIWGNIKDFFGGSAVQADLHDNGGIVRPGYSTILNKTGKPEALLNPQQWSDISKLALTGGGGRDIVINGNVGWMPDEVAREIAVRERREMTMAGLSGVVFA